MTKAMILNEYIARQSLVAITAAGSRDAAASHRRRVAAIWRNSDTGFVTMIRELREECLSFVMPAQQGSPVAGHGDSN
jgi:hypothetical protein